MKIKKPYVRFCDYKILKRNLEISGSNPIKNIFLHLKKSVIFPFVYPSFQIRKDIKLNPKNIKVLRLGFESKPKQFYHMSEK